MNQQILEHMAKHAGVLSNPKRLEILMLLTNSAMTAGDVAQATNLTGPNLSQHLSLMKQHGLVSTRRDGTNVIYSANGVVHTEILANLKAAVIHQLEQQRDLLQSAYGVTV